MCNNLLHICIVIYFTMSRNIPDTIPESHLTYGKKRKGEIMDLAKTKFGSSVVHVKPNREEERFDIIVQSNVKQTDITDFEKLWTMCKILKIS